MTDYQWLSDIAGMMDQAQHKRRRFDRKKNKWAYFNEDGPITADMIADNLKGGDECIGGLMLPDGEKTRFLVFDFDDHEKKTDGGIIASRVAAVCDTLHHNKIPFFVVRSGGGHGYHIWVVLESAKRSDAARELGKAILEATNKGGVGVWPNEEFVGKGANWTLIRDETDEVLKVELLPKGSGEQCVALPLSRDGYLCEVNIGDDGHCYVWEKHPAPESFSFETYKGKKRGAPRTGDHAAVDADDAFDKLAAKYDPNEYDDWFKIAMRLIAAFGIDNAWARDRWWRWSEPFSESPKDEQKWIECRNTHLSPITFWLDARDAGYDGKFPFKSTDERKLTVLALLDDVRLLRDEIGQPYAQLSERRFVHIKSEEFRSEMYRRYYHARGRVPETHDIDAMIEAASAFAAAEEREPINLRFAEFGDKRFLFLADEDHTVIEIDADGWRVCDEPDVLFRKGDGLPMPMPRDGDLDALLDFFNIDRENMTFVLAWMLNALYFPGQQCPILLLDGTAGSGKSSALSVIVRLLDPKIGAEAGPPKSEDDLFVSAYGGAIVSFDNVSTLAKLSDALCRLSTRGGLRKRMLYTDFDVAAMDAQRPIIVAGIDPTMYEQDLLERIVRVELHDLETHMDDKQFEVLFAKQRPKMTGAVLTLLSAVMRRIATVSDSWGRFGTYSRLGECVAQELGFGPGWFIEEYRARFEEMATEAAESDSVVKFIQMTVASEGSGDTRLEMTAGKLWDLMQEEISNGMIKVPIGDVPRNPRVMSSRINRASKTLARDHGIRVSRGKRRSFIFEWDEGSVEALLKLIRRDDPSF